MSEHLGHGPADDGVREDTARDLPRAAGLVDPAAAAHHGLPARLGAELLGSFVLVLGGVGTALWAAVPGVGVGPLGVALAFGLALLVSLLAFGHVSGGHFNPVVTLGAAVAGRAPWRDVVPYWLAQLLGAGLASSILFVVASDNPQLGRGDVEGFFRAASNTFGPESPLQFGMLAALVIELVVAGVFVAIVLAVTARAARASLAAPVVGAAYAVGLLVLSPVTGGSLNPARSLASAVFAGTDALGQVWLFALAPLLGAAIAAMLFALLQPIDEDALAAEHALVDEDALAAEHALADEDALALEPDATETEPLAGEPAEGADLEPGLVRDDRGEDGEQHAEAQQRGHVEGP